MAFPDDLTVFEFIDDCPAGRDLEQEIDTIDNTLLTIQEDITDVEDDLARKGTKAII